MTIDATNPIPQDTGAIGYNYLKGDPYINFLPGYENFPQMLLEARMLSVTHNSCVSTKSTFCAGLGFEDTDGKELDQAIIDWFDNMNLKNEGIVQLNENAFNSLGTFGNTPVEIVRFTVGGEKKMFIYVHDLQEWRLGIPDMNDIPQYAVTSKLFRQYSTWNKFTMQAARTLPLYSPHKTEAQNWQQMDDGSQRTCIWYRENTTGYPYYGLPKAVSGMIYQLLEYKGARYNLDNFDNNMIVAAVLALRGNLSQAEANRIAKDIIKQHTGDGKRGRTAVIASQEGIDGSTFHNMSTTQDGSYINAKESWRQDIILANEWDAILAGLVNASTLGKGAGFLTKLIEWKQRTVIHPAQNRMMRNVWSLVFKAAEQWMNLPFSQYKLKFKNDIDISGLTDVDITPAVTVGEVRRAKGLPLFGDARDNQMMTPAKGAANSNMGGDTNNG